MVCMKEWTSCLLLPCLIFVLGKEPRAEHLAAELRLHFPDALAAQSGHRIKF